MQLQLNVNLGVHIDGCWALSLLKVLKTGLAGHFCKSYQHNLLASRGSLLGQGRAGPTDLPLLSTAPIQLQLLVLDCAGGLPKALLVPPLQLPSSYISSDSEEKQL